MGRFLIIHDAPVQLAELLVLFPLESVVVFRGFFSFGGVVGRVDPDGDTVLRHGDVLLGLVGAVLFQEAGSCQGLAQVAL